MKQQLIICKGAPGSGKTTFAHKWVAEDPKKRTRISRDDIRRMLGPYWIPSREDLVTSIERDSLRAAITEGYSTIVDATNFKDQWIIDCFNNWKKFTPELELIYKDFTDVPLEECIRRDALRSGDFKVGETVIRNFYEKYIKK